MEYKKRKELTAKTGPVEQAISVSAKMPKDTPIAKTVSIESTPLLKTAKSVVESKENYDLEKFEKNLEDMDKKGIASKSELMKTRTMMEKIRQKKK